MNGADYATRGMIGRVLGKSRAYIRHHLLRDGIQPALRVGNQDLYGVDQMPEVFKSVTTAYRPHELKQRKV